MAYTKRLADLLTGSRVLFALIFAWLGLTGARESLALAGFIILASWITDLLDGPLARQSRAEPTWIGDHDLEVDATVSVGVLVYLVGVGFLEPAYALAYALLCVLIFWRWGWRRDPVMLLQAPIYLWFILIAVRNVPQIGWWLAAYPVVAIVVTWPRFPREIVPNFIAGMKRTRRGK